ncbi:MAG: 4Fe-4S binding protein [Clostridiales bacterium]|nr:4Fe-4S binding protein [Clostridiales bacterium]
MAYVINDKCISCGVCEDSCPVSAISAGEDRFVINADECISCGACADTCPQEAILED